MSKGPKSLIDEATPWIDAALRAVGRSRTGPVSIERDRPWALVASLPSCALATGSNPVSSSPVSSSPVSSSPVTVWFKANHEAFAYEASVLEHLDQLAPGTVLRPLATHPDHRWFLADDGGPVADADEHMTLDKGAIVDAYVRVQRASESLQSDLAAVGVPIRDSAQLLDLFDQAVAHPQAGSGAERCTSLRPLVIAACDLLDPAPLVLTNSDLKPSHVFVGPPPRLFDWGDALFAHPLASCGTIDRAFGRAAAARYAEAWNADPDGSAVRAGAALVDLLNLDAWLRDPAAALDRHPGQIEKLLNRLADALLS